MIGAVDPLAEWCRRWPY